MTTYRYAATHVVTGETLADTLPLEVQSFSQQLNGGGQLTGNLDLSQAYSQNTPFLDALIGRAAVIWVLADDYPTWNGVLLDKPDSSRAQGTLPLTAYTLDAIFSKRLITATLEYQDIDIFTVFLDLLKYGTSKRSPFITTLSPVQGPPSALVADRLPVAGLVLPSGAAATSGVSWSSGYLYSDLTAVSDAWSNLTQSGNLEFVFQPGLDSQGNWVTNVRLGYNRLGRDYAECGYSFTYPGNALDYGKQETGSQASNVVIATAPPNGSPAQWQSQYPHGYDLADLNNGYPVMESTVQWQGSSVTRQAQVDSFADGQLGIVSEGMVTPVISAGGSGVPGILDLILGDTFQFAATSDADPPGPEGEPGYQPLLRLTGWSVTPPGPNSPESIQLTTSQILATANQ